MQKQMQAFIQSQLLEMKKEMVKTLSSQQPNSSVQSPQPQTPQQQAFGTPLEPPIMSQQAIRPPAPQIPPTLPNMPPSIIQYNTCQDNQIGCQKNGQHFTSLLTAPQMSLGTATCTML
uniref:Uncharacterized protein n=1 Tax=Musca domestica TaxID=7370 RepID=A0A1I8NKR3_MUSDO